VHGRTLVDSRRRIKKFFNEISNTSIIPLKSQESPCGTKGREHLLAAAGQRKPVENAADLQILPHRARPSTRPRRFAIGITGAATRQPAAFRNRNSCGPPAAPLTSRPGFFAWPAG